MQFDLLDHMAELQNELDLMNVDHAHEFELLPNVVDAEAEISNSQEFHKLQKGVKELQILKI